MIWLTVILLLLLSVLLLHELLYWFSELADKIIILSVRLLPLEFQQRYLEEFKAALYEVDSRICRLIRSLTFIRVAWLIRREMYMIFAGEFAYTLLDHERDTYLEGICTLEPNCHGLAVYGYLLKEIEFNQNGHQHIRQVKIPWHSHAVNLSITDEERNTLVVQYQIRIQARLVEGQFEVGFQDNRIYGHLNRWPINRGSFSLWKRQGNTMCSNIYKRLLFLADYIVEKKSRKALSNSIN